MAEVPRERVCSILEELEDFIADHARTIFYLPIRKV